jgi:hypothetical protein
MIKVETDGETFEHPDADIVYPDSGMLRVAAIEGGIFNTIAVYAPGQWLSARRVSDGAGVASR